VHGARDRLSRLIELAGEDAPERRRMLAVELCDLLLDWPESYPASTREPFEALLEKTMQMIDRQTRHALVWRIAERTDAPLEFLNEFYFDASDEVRHAILLRNAELQERAAFDAEPGDLESAADGARLVEAARTRPGEDFAHALTDIFGIGSHLAERIADDVSAEGLAIVAKGAHIGRAAFSAIALLTSGKATPDASAVRLSAFDVVPQAAAERMLAFWKMRHGVAPIAAHNTQAA
jgi:hypothetical protein